MAGWWIGLWQNIKEKHRRFVSYHKMRSKSAMSEDFKKAKARKKR